jgi:hypothetical protein
MKTLSPVSLMPCCRLVGEERGTGKRTEARQERRKASSEGAARRLEGGGYNDNRQMNEAR